MVMYADLATLRCMKETLVHSTEDSSLAVPIYSTEKQRLGTHCLVFLNLHSFTSTISEGFILTETSFTGVFKILAQ